MTETLGEMYDRIQENRRVEVLEAFRTDHLPVFLEMIKEQILQGNTNIVIRFGTIPPICHEMLRDALEDEGLAVAGTLPTLEGTPESKTDYHINRLYPAVIPQTA